MTIYAERPLYDYNPSYKDQPTTFKLKAVIRLDNSGDQIYASELEEFDTANFDWSSERDVNVISELRALDSIIMKDSGLSNTVTLYKDQYIDVNASEALKDLYFRFQEITGPSLKGIYVGNQYNECIYIVVTNSSDAVVMQKKLYPGAILPIPGDLISTIKYIDVYLYKDGSDDDLEKSLIQASAGADVYIQSSGQFFVKFDNVTKISMGTYALSAGIAIGGATLDIEAILDLISPLTSTFQQIATKIGQTAKTLITGYAAGWAGLLNLGWKELGDVLDFDAHKEMITAIAQNPSAILSVGASIATQYMPTMIRVAGNAAAAYGIAMAVLAYNETTKRYFFPATRVTA